MTHASGQIHLLDVRVRPCAYVKEVIEGSWKNLQDGAEKGFGRTLYGFKVSKNNQSMIFLCVTSKSGYQSKRQFRHSMTTQLEFEYLFTEMKC